MFKIAFFAAAMISCMKPTTPSVPNMHDMSGFAGPTYVATNSPCIDGLLVNLGNSCKTLIEIQGEGVITYIQCHEAKNKNSPWDKYTFVVIGDPSIGHPPSTQLLCADLAATIYFKERF